MPAPPEHVLEALAARHGAVARRDLVRLANAQPTKVDEWLRSGWFTRVHRGVYVLKGAPGTPEQTAQAAVLRGGDGAMCGPWSSLALHRIEGFGLRAGDLVDVVVPAQRRVRGTSSRVRRLSVPPVDRMTLAGLPVLSPTRALIEVAAEIGDRRLRVAIDSARRRDLLSTGLLHSRAHSLRNHPGAAVVRRLLDAGATAAESEGERNLLALVADFDPPPECQVADLVPGCRFDLAWRLLRYALEYDGREHHVLPTDRDADGTRDLACAEAGVLVQRVTAGMLRDAREATLRGIRTTFEQRSRRFGLR
jgi:hypothetical protein